MKKTKYVHKPLHWTELNKKISPRALRIKQDIAMVMCVKENDENTQMLMHLAAYVQGVIASTEHNLGFEP